MALRMVDISTESYTCPPLTDADYHTSSRLTSPKSSRKESRSPMAASKGPAFGENGDYAEEKLTIDPRRFTPTLHANLVSEILALRREVEQKNNLVLNLEEHIAQTRDENATLNNLISSSSREKKSLKRQMDALENGTLAAIEDIARERDQAIESLADIKVQLERSQKKVKGQEEDINRTQDIWQRDQENWKTERRGFERKIHVVEGRLKTVLTEVAAQSNSQRRSFDNPQYWARERSSSRASGQRSAASHYRDSSITGGQITGKTLADELNIESVSDADSEDYDSAEALPEELERPRSYSSHSNRQSIKARKLLGLPIDATDDTGSFRDSVHKRYSQALSTHITTPSTPVYRDTATQYSPPPSPKMIPDQQRLSTITEFDGESMLDEPMLRPWSSEFERVRFIQMVSSACQTIETPLSPPETPVRSKSEHSEIRRPIMTTNSTQTSENLFTATMGLRTSVPLIAIHPVNSDNGVVLPPNSRNASTQAHIMGDVTSTAVQTDTIRTDERLTKLPAHLHPAIIQPVSPAPSLAPSPAPEAQQEKEINRDLPSSSWPRLQISHQKANVARSILRRSVLTATKDQHHSEDDLSDDSFLNKISTKKILSKVNDSWQMVSSPIDINENITDTEDTPLQLSNLELSDSNLKAPRSMASSPPKKMKGRASQMSQIPGSVSSQPKRFSTDSQTNIGRVRSPSEPIRPDRTNGLPFPVPDRSSSRKFPWLTDDGMESPTPKSGKNNKWHRPPKRRPGIRKSRSEIGDRQFRSHSRSPSPQPFDVFTDSLANIPPPLPENEITTPRSTTLRKPSIVQSAPSQTESTRSDQTTIVDSIAQTMIGEWMYKYVRRRKSFGIPDEAGTGESSVNGGIRHQRWVWVAPYERAVMWSSRQPTSGTALMGKSGRKLVISSVLDVHDDTPMPKGAPKSSYFGRSILILTPQRALKFTAISIERHYVWMNALSFLSQGAVDFADIIDQPPPLPTSVGTENSRYGSANSHRPAQPSMDSSLHRSKVNDSIRIAKGRERPSPAGRTPTNPVQNGTSQSLLNPETSLGAEAPTVPRTTAGTRRRSRNPLQSQANSMKSQTSSNKTSIQSLRSRPAEPHSEVPSRPPVRLQPRIPSRTVSENPVLRDEFRDQSNQQGYPDERNLFEAVGTIRMSAFVQDTTDNYISNHHTPNLKKAQAAGRSVSYDNMETQIGRDVPHMKYYGRVLGTRKHDQSKKLQNGIGERSESALTNHSVLSGSQDPFEGF